MADVSTFRAYPAPAQLVEHCTRVATRNAASTSARNAGKWDLADVTALYAWLNEHDAFASYDDWILAGMISKCEFGDAGLDLWASTHDDTVTDDVVNTKWESFADTPTASGVALGTLLTRAHGLGWKGTIRQSTASMFGAVAQIAADAGATLQGAPSPVAGMPMMAGQKILSDIGLPDVEAFLANTMDVPNAPLNNDLIQLPDNCSVTDLVIPLQAAILRVLAMAEQAKGWNPERIVDSMALLKLVHQSTYDAVRRRAVTSGRRWPDTKIDGRATKYEENVKWTAASPDDWRLDHKGEKEHDNSDNVTVHLNHLALSVRWNAWLERMEIQGGNESNLTWKTWTYVDDKVVSKLRNRANRTGTRFKPGKDFFYDAILSLADSNQIDPARDAIAALETAWDGTARLHDWLAKSCGTPADAYHRAVGRNIIGGMVKRARYPGIKHDTMAVLYGFQGSGKSTLAVLLAPCAEWFTDAILLGTDSKELVLALAGKMVVEIGEMGMRGGANPALVKKMLSAQFDEGRTAYARAVSKRMRRNIFLGTTNEDEPLSDSTGNRRFLPVRIDQYIDLEWLRTNIGQLIGEAAALETQGQSFDIPVEVWGDATERQEAARQESDTEILLKSWFAETPYTSLAYITAADLAHLAAFAGWRTNGARGNYMRRLGFRSAKPYIGGNKTDVWVRGPAILPRHIEREGVCYLVGKDAHGRPTVTIRTAVGAGAAPTLPPVLGSGAPVAGTIQ